MHWDAIRGIHLELTTKCNASCPQCPRTIDGGPINKQLPLIELTLSNIKNIVGATAFPDLAEIQLCGNYGDPIIAKDCCDICEYVRSENKNVEIRIHTNGSARTPEWWRKLARIVTRVRFGIDGLADTNYLYRRGTQWNTIMRNVRSFIEGGGRAEWEFIVFEHNQHQIKEASELAQRLGFKKFFIKKTSRFFYKNKSLNQTAVRNLNGETEYFLRRPTLPEMQNSVVEELVEKRLLNNLEFYDQTPIKCQALGGQRIYVSAGGHVFPCCWIGSLYNKSSFEMDQVKELIEECGGLGAISAQERTVAEITRGKFFALVMESWRKATVKSGRLQRCARMCGECDLSGGQRSMSLI